MRFSEFIKSPLCNFNAKNLILLIQIISTVQALERCTGDGIVYDENELGERTILPTKFCNCRSANGTSFDGDTSLNEQCCAGAENPVFVTTHSLCNGTTVIPKHTMYLKQCGPNQVYNIRLSQGCQKDDEGRYVVSNFDNRPITTPPLLDIDMECSPPAVGCCSGNRLSKNQLCCDNGNVIEKTQPQHDDVCMCRETFATATHACVGRRVVQLPSEGHGVCGNGFYNLEADLCCSGNLYEGSRLQRHKCCGVSLEDRETACCDGEPHRKQAGYECCGNQYQLNGCSRPSLLDSLRTYYFIPDTNNHHTACSGRQLCQYSGTLVIPEDSDLRFDLQRKIEYFRVALLGRRNPKKLRGGKCYVILSTKILSYRSIQLRLRNKKNILAMPRKTCKHLKQYIESMPKPMMDIA